MENLIHFIMQDSTTLTVEVAIRIAIVFALIEMIKSLCVALVKGGKP